MRVRNEKNLKKWVILKIKWVLMYLIKKYVFYWKLKPKKLCIYVNFSKKKKELFDDNVNQKIEVATFPSPLFWQILFWTRTSKNNIIYRLCWFWQKFCYPMEELFSYKRTFPSPLFNVSITTYLVYY